MWEVEGRSTAEIAKELGIKESAVRHTVSRARTFQNLRLFGELSALENVAIAGHIHNGSNLWTGIFGLPVSRREEEKTYKRAEELLDLVGLTDQSNRKARNLAYGDQRRLEIARALALQPQLLLLDEPAAGMNPSEKGALSQLIRQIDRLYFELWQFSWLPLHFCGQRYLERNQSSLLFV